jgi:hypothetical protein
MPVNFVFHKTRQFINDSLTPQRECEPYICYKRSPAVSARSHCHPYPVRVELLLQRRLSSELPTNSNRNIDAMNAARPKVGKELPACQQTRRALGNAILRGITGVVWSKDAQLCEVKHFAVWLWADLVPIKLPYLLLHICTTRKISGTSSTHYCFRLPSSLSCDKESTRHLGIVSNSEIIKTSRWLCCCTLKIIWRTALWCHLSIFIHFTWSQTEH